MSKPGNVSPTRLWRASTGTPIRLGAELGRGGEGAVFDVQGASPHVAKIYLKPLAPLKIEKLATMARSAKPNLLSVAAWPVDSLVDERKVVRGFLMPKVSGREDLHELYSPKSRAETFPEADFRFIVRVAANLARAFATLHAQGHVIGDVNHGNALVGRDGTVMLIDCDSIQTRDRVKTYPCDVGVPLFTAPELQGMDFRGLRRSVNHDGFGLAVLLFHLLFQGRHPFAGRFVDGEMTIERAVAEYRFAYGDDTAATGMLPPPGTLPLRTFGQDIARLFLLAFTVRAADGNRPSALEWVASLDALERSLVECTTSPHHFHPPGGRCCWCELERDGSYRFFGRSLIAIGRTVADVDMLWRAIGNVSHPGSGPGLPRSMITPLREKRGLSSPGVRRLLNRSGIVLGIVSVIAVLIGYPLAILGFYVAIFAVGGTVKSRRAARTRKQAIQQASAAWKKLLLRWNDECSSASFDNRLAELANARLEFIELTRRCKEEIDQYLKSESIRGLRHHLSSFSVDQLPWEALSRSQRKRLKSYGIRTAADVERDESAISSLLGEKTAAPVLAWYRSRRASFSGTNAAPDPREIEAIQQRYADMQERLAKQLSEGPALLREDHRAISAARARLSPSMQSAWDNLERVRQGE